MLIDDAKHALYLGDEVLVVLAARVTLRHAIRRCPADRQRSTCAGVGRRGRPGQGTVVGVCGRDPGVLADAARPETPRVGGPVWKGGAAPLPPALYASPRLSPDGQTVAFKIGGEFGDIWTHRLVDGSTAQLTFDGRSGDMIWTADGSELTIATLRGTVDELVQVRADGKGPPEPLHFSSPAGFYKRPRSWLREGTLALEVRPPPRARRFGPFRRRAVRRDRSARRADVRTSVPGRALDCVRLQQVGPTGGVCRAVPDGPRAVESVKWRRLASVGEKRARALLSRRSARDVRADCPGRHVRVGAAANLVHRTVLRRGARRS